MNVIGDFDALGALLTRKVLPVGFTNHTITIRIHNLCVFSGPFG